MSSARNFANINLHSPIRFSPRRCRRALQIRVWRRRRLKSIPSLVVRSQLGPLVPSTFENLFHALVSQFPSVNSLDLVAPVLGFASGVALYLSRFRSGEDSDIGEWILFTSPTPFNRFVLIRCPSISFEGSELLEDVSERLVKEDRHFVRLNSGRIQVRGYDGRDAIVEEKLAYQRECVGMDDGGVVSLDWPANLDLTEEHGLDTTVLLIPGTAEGSMDPNVRSFVCEALRRGYFPVVMNPRGCAGSPLTTARLFTAADSDDICTAIQFINRARPWTTMMGVGWGYGANMLTKYLAEVGEKTPLTAATCIDNPFDLEEASRVAPNHIAVDQKLRGGLIDILRSNKELFQGRTKGFDVEKALSAKTVRDFEQAISMVSYGFDSIEDFYSKSSTRGIVGNVKIPVLFIQNDDGTTPLFSIPRSLIAENPFTSLLLCSCSPTTVILSGRSAISWCQNVTIEWLAAVELGLLKGRHPLLKDVDVTINPLKGLAFLEGRAPPNSSRVNKFFNPEKSSALSEHSMDPVSEMLAATNIRPGQDSWRNLEIEDKESRQVHNGTLQQSSSVDAELIKEDVISSVDNERGQVLQTAQVVMNMLDVTMPGTLTEEHKKKVLAAVGQGETVMQALQDAVPEDVRGKLTTAVSGILHTQGTNLNFEGLLRIGQIPNVSSGLKSKIQEEIGITSSGEGMHKDAHSSDQRKGADDVADGTNNNQSGDEKPAGRLETELQPSEKLQKSIDPGQAQPVGGQGSEVSSSVNKSTIDAVNNQENNEFSKEKPAQYSENSGNGSETGANPNFSSRSEKAGGTEEAISDHQKLDHDGRTAQIEMKEENHFQNNEGKILDSSTDQNKMIPSTKIDEAVSPPGSSSEPQVMEKEGSDNQKKEDKTMQPILDQNNTIMSDSNSPTFTVSQALDTLTGVDDSTQVAVNSVFGVIEDMITQLEEKGNQDEVIDKDVVKDEKSGSERQNNQVISNHKLEKEEDNENGLNFESDILHDPTVPSGHENHTDTLLDAGPRWVEEKSSQTPIPFRGNGTGSSRNYTDSHVGKKEDGKDHFVGDKLLARSLDRHSHINNIPLYITATPYGDSLYNEYLRKYILSKIPNTKSLDLDTTTALFLDYFPEEGQWKLLEQPGNTGDSVGDVRTLKGVDRMSQAYSSSKNNTGKIIEPSYVILDTEKQHEPVRGYKTVDIKNEKAALGNDRSEELICFVKNIIVDALKVEVSRRLSASYMKEMEFDLARDLEQIANAVSLIVGQDKEHGWHVDSNDYRTGHTIKKVGTVNGERIVRAISSAIQDTSHLRRVLPVGVIVGSSLAALRKFFNIAAVHDTGQNEAVTLDGLEIVIEKSHGQVSETENDQTPSDKTENLNLEISRDRKKAKLGNLNSTVMVGAVTAALGASALLVNQRDPYNGNETADGSSKPFKEKGTQLKEPYKIEETLEKNQNNIVTSLAEKAMSVAGPVVPTKEDGEVDQERLVAMLADLGQKGGMLKLVGKIGLLWGGLRGAMSLTDRLITFLRIADRPLFQRILGFVCMVLVLWSPVVVPLLPTLVMSWTTNNSSRIAELVCIVGLYTAVVILVMLWGKRIRGYEKPFEEYGLDLTSSPEIQNFLKGLIGGVMLVMSIHSVNALLGFVSLSWPAAFDTKTLFKVYGKMLMLTVRGIVTAVSVSLVEELLFRSWLPEEIAPDLGYNRGIIISGLAFSLFQRSPLSIPGLWLLSLVLAGARQRSQGSLSLPIGLRAGIMASSFILQIGGFIKYQPNFPLWVTGTHPLQPFSGVVGLAFSMILAIVLYPRQPLHKKKTKTLQE
ncbi:hypothetical protein PVL29_013878 [Vitis rotundifolia]|uniref:Embryogenesis-associated protein EMB8 n=2 Tax=Vitis rotundifolia TaxID=103349 RepID=A0AA39DK69_VITRO|nr:hypothetical protein PVL29_013878 [Vitis rotundifolia]